MLRNALLLNHRLRGDYLGGLRLIHLNHGPVLLHNVFLSHLLNLNYISLIIVFRRNMASSSDLMSRIGGSHYLGLRSHRRLLVLNITISLVHIGGHRGGELGVHISSRSLSLNNILYNLLRLLGHHLGGLALGVVSLSLGLILNHLHGLRSTLYHSGGLRGLVIIYHLVFGQISSGSILVQDVGAYSGRIGVS